MTIRYGFPIDRIELNTEDYKKYTRTDNGIYYEWLPIPESPVTHYSEGNPHKVYDIGKNGKSEVYYVFNVDGKDTEKTGTEVEYNLKESGIIEDKR